MRESSCVRCGAHPESFPPHSATGEASSMSATGGETVCNERDATTAAASARARRDSDALLILSRRQFAKWLRLDDAREVLMGWRPDALTNKQASSK